jgi:nicotinamidase-related amidase
MHPVTTPRGIWFAVLAAGLLSLTGLSGAGEGESNKAAAGGKLRLHLRTRVETFKGSGAWDEVVLTREFAGPETALLICDMWDKHWCQNASRRCGVLAKKMSPVLEAARSKGVQIIHAPSECMKFYKDTPQRRAIQKVKAVAPPRPLDIAEPALPIDATDGGCDDAQPGRSYQAWTRQHADIKIADQDVISDSGTEIYSLLRQRGIKNLIIMGVHTNMCVLGRSFGIRQMTRWGIRCVLVRDLTDAMYNPKKAPFVSHERGTELVVQHIEKYWCPSILSRDIKEDKAGGEKAKAR